MPLTRVWAHDLHILTRSVFRYRDYRNKGRSPTAPAGSNASSSYGDEDADTAAATAAANDNNDAEEEEADAEDQLPTDGGSSVQTRQGSSGVGAGGGELEDQGSLLMARLTRTSAHIASSQYWDPVRERWQS